MNKALTEDFLNGYLICKMSISTIIFHIWILIFINSDEASITAPDESFTSVTVPMTFSQTAQDTIETTSLVYQPDTSSLSSSSSTSSSSSISSSSAASSTSSFSSSSAPSSSSTPSFLTSSSSISSSAAASSTSSFSSSSSLSSSELSSTSSSPSSSAETSLSLVAVRTTTESSLSSSPSSTTTSSSSSSSSSSTPTKTIAASTSGQTFNISTTELWSSDISSHSRIESSTNKTYRSKGDTNADSIGSIIGGSLGGVVFVAITVVVLVCCIKRCRSTPYKQEISNDVPVSFSSGNSTGGSSVNIDMQPIDDRLNLPVEINQPRDSLFTDLSFGALLRRSSNRSMKSIKSNRSNRQKNIKRDRVDDRPQYLNRPSQLMAFMWQTIRRRRSRSFTNTNSQNNFKRKVSKSKSLNDLTDELNSKSHLEVHKTCTDPSMSKYNSQSTETISTNDAISIKDDSDIQTDSSINSHPTFEVIVTSYD